MISLEELVAPESETLPSKIADIPSFLYKPSSKSRRAAELIIFEHITDPTVLAKRSGLLLKSAR